MPETIKKIKLGTLKPGQKFRPIYYRWDRTEYIEDRVHFISALNEYGEYETRNWLKQRNWVGDDYNTFYKNADVVLVED